MSRELWLKAGEAGLLGTDTPEEHGGIGGTFLDAAIIMEEQWVKELCTATKISSMGKLARQQQNGDFTDAKISGKMKFDGAVYCCHDM